MPREYEQIKMYKAQIFEMRESGKTFREIAEHFGFKDKYVVKEFFKRERRNILKAPKPRGRKPAVTLQECKYEIKRLRMENELLRDFLKGTERG